MKSVMRIRLTTMAGLLLGATMLQAQPGILTKELLTEYTPEWHGERFADGCLEMPDDILDRMKTVTLEEAWAVLQLSTASCTSMEDGLAVHPSG